MNINDILLLDKRFLEILPDFILLLNYRQTLQSIQLV